MTMTSLVLRDKLINGSLIKRVDDHTVTLLSLSVTWRKATIASDFLVHSTLLF